MEQENFESIQSRRNKLRVMLQPQQPSTPFESKPFIFNSLTMPSKSSSSVYEYPSSSFEAPCNDGLIRNLVPMGPFNGYASVLKGSKFLKPTQQLLEDFCGGSAVLDSCPSPLDGLRENENKNDQITVTGRNAIQSKLVCMLEEVYNKYTLYCQQMQSTIASFHEVAGLENSTPYISFGIKNISKHFGCLKHAIYDQLQFTNKNYSATFQLNNLNSVQPILRSQRGLPEHAVVLLKKWLFEHFLHPYLTDFEKDKLAQMTGLTRSQVSNWFINARVRIWKPMIEEMNDQQAQPIEVDTFSPSTLEARYHES